MRTLISVAGIAVVAILAGLYAQSDAFGPVAIVLMAAVVFVVSLSWAWVSNREPALKGGKKPGVGPAPAGSGGDLGRRRAAPAVAPAAAPRASEPPPAPSPLAPAPAPEPPAMAARAPEEIEPGLLAYLIPEHMRKGRRETVEVRIGTVEAKQFLAGFGEGKVGVEGVDIVESMSVYLSADDPDAFEIKSQSPQAQQVKLAPEDSARFQDFGRWVWFVTPLRTGDHGLTVKVALASRDRHGNPASKSLADKVIGVTVRVDWWGMVVLAAWRSAAAAALAIVSEVVKEFLWPVLWPAVSHFLFG